MDINDDYKSNDGDLEEGTSDEDILTEAKESFQRIYEAEAKNRDNWLDDIKFARLGIQWPEEIRRQRELEGRPCLTINRLPAFIRQVTNDARQNSPSIKCHPVGDGADEEVAEVLNGLIRNIEYTSNADVAYDTALDHAVTAGFGYFRIVTEYADDDAFDQDIKIERIANPLTVYGDPYSTSADSADWDEAFITDLITRSDFKKRYPKAQETEFKADQKDRDIHWFDDERIRIAEYWRRKEVPATLLLLTDGSTMFEPEYLRAKELLDIQGITIKATRQTKTKKVTQYIISGAEVIETNPWAGKYIPIVPVYGDEVDVEGERHFISLVRFAKDSARMMNFWRTASTELVALAPKTPFIGAAGSFVTDAEKWATANTQTHAYIEYDPVPNGSPPQRQQFAGPPAGALQEALNASDDMKSIMGIFDASLGARSNETSGRAILARQREGDTSTFNFIDNLSRAIRHAGRIIVDLIPKVYSTQRIIRVIKEDGTNESVPINQPFQAPPPKAEDAAEEAREQMQGITKLYDLTTGKYDVTCEAGPSFTTKREESANQMMEFVQAFPQSAQFIGDLIAKNLDWPGADDIAKRLKLMLPPQIQGQNPQLQQMQQQMQQMDGQAKQAIAQLHQEMQQKDMQLKSMQQDKQIEAQKLQIDQFNAETNRMKALKELQPIQQVQEVQQTQEQMSEAEKMRFDAEVKLALEDKKHQGAMELELLKQRADIAKNNTDAAVIYDENFTPNANPVVDSLTALAQHIASMNATLHAPRRLIRDEQGKAIGAVIDTGEQ